MAQQPGDSNGFLTPLLVEACVTITCWITHSVRVGLRIGIATYPMCFWCAKISTPFAALYKVKHKTEFREMINVCARCDGHRKVCFRLAVTFCELFIKRPSWLSKA